MSEQKHNPQRAAKPGADDLAILNPEREITVAGRRLTIREYGFIEGLKLAAEIGPLTQALTDAALAGEALAPETLRGIFAAHTPELISLIARATGAEPEWIEGLGDADGQTLLFAWWTVNSGFFVRRIVERAALARLSGAHAGATSSSSSLNADTIRPTSAVTRAVN